VKLHAIPVCFLVKTRTTTLKDEIFEEIGRKLIPDLFMTFICEISVDNLQIAERFTHCRLPMAGPCSRV
jgi:hypothetical protein